VIVEADRLRTELARACEDADLDPGAWVVWIVDAARPPGTTPIAYLQPAGEVKPETVLVFRAAGAERVRPYRLVAHRLAVWHKLPGFPEAALGPMLRHELEHARRWEASGTVFYEADERLRASVGPAGYAQLPTEREANAAAAAYARRALTEAQLDELHACGEFADLLAEDHMPVGVVAATLAFLGQKDMPGDSPQPWPGGTMEGGPVIELVASAV
jgi:hypothetical protein